MPGTRTAPTVDGTPPYKSVSFRFIDSTGDKRSFSVKVPNAVTDVDIEAAVVALQAATNASIHEVTVTQQYAGAALASNALSDVHQSVYDNVVILYKDDSVPISQNGFIPAPLDALTDSDDNVDTGNATYIAARDAINTILAAGYTAISTRYTERREKNDSQPA